MAIVLALPRLFDAVTARFALEGTNVHSIFGWRAPAEGAQLNPGPRIVWVPGNPNGDIGKVVAPRGPGGNPRPLATLEELFFVDVVTADTDSPEDERAQYQAARELFDAWYRAVYLAARGTFAIVSSAWLGANKLRLHGAGIRVVCSIQSMIPDEVLLTAPVDTTANLDVEELDVTETLTVDPSEEP